MSNYVIFPDCCPVQFAELNKAKDARINTRHLNDGWWFSEQITDTNNPQDKVKYRQKWLHNDIINIQVSTNADSSPTLSIYRCNNTLVAEDTAYQTATVSGNKAPDGTALVTYQWWFSPSFYGVGSVNGDYYFKLTSPFTEGNIVHISEPQHFSNYHPDTVLIKYSNNFNKQYSIFEQLYNRYSIRISGALHGYEAGSENTGFVDQDGTFVQLDNITYEVWKLTLAGRKGIPDYEIKKLNEIFSLDSFSIDNKQFTLNEGSNFDYQGLQQYPLRGTTIQLRKKENPRALITKDLASPFYFTAPYPHFAYNLELSDGVNVIPIPDRVVEDLADGEDWADTLNLSSLMAQEGLTGFFSFADGRLIYNNDDTENYSASGASYNSFAEVEFTISSGAFDFDYRGAGIGIDWADGNIETSASPTVVLTVAHTYSSSGAKTMRIFHNDAIYSITFSYPALLFRQINNITGTFGQNVLSHTITFGDLDTGFDFDYLEDSQSQSQIQTLVIRNCGMQDNFLSTFFDASSNPNLRTIDLRNNEITTSGVNDFITQFYNKISWNVNPASKIIRLQGQTPSAPPSGAAIGYITTMANAGVTITTD